MKFLVLGASGFLGSYVGYGLEAAGHEAIGVARRPVPHYSQARMVASLGEVQKEILSDSWDVVINCIAVASHEACEESPREAERINAELPGMWARAARDTGARFLHVSTDAVFDGATGNYSETDPTNPFSIYGESKLAGEVAAMNETNALIVRTNFFGWSPTRTRSILEFFINNLEANINVPGFTDFTVTSLYVRQCAEVIRQLARKITEQEDSNIWHVASTDALTKYEFGVEVANIFGLNPELIVAQESPRENNHQVSRSRNISLNTTKTQQFLNQAGLPPLKSQREEIIQASKERTLVP